MRARRSQRCPPPPPRIALRRPWRAPEVVRWRPRQEIESAEEALAQLVAEPDASLEAAIDLAELTFPYVGGRPHQVAQLRKIAERCGATLTHHDGGIDDRSGLLEAQVARADRTLFPVDCVSHNAVAVVKRVARATGKPYTVLRSSSLASFTAALRSMAAEVRRPEAVGSQA